MSQFVSLGILAQLRAGPFGLPANREVCRESHVAVKELESTEDEIGSDGRIRCAESARR